MITAITHHHWDFLKQAYKHPEIELTDHERHIRSGTQYLTYDDGQWRVWKMTPERVSIPRGRYRTINAAVVAAKQ